MTEEARGLRLIENYERSLKERDAAEKKYATLTHQVRLLIDRWRCGYDSGDGAYADELSELLARVDLKPTV